MRCRAIVVACIYLLAAPARADETGSSPYAFTTLLDPKYLVNPDPRFKPSVFEPVALVRTDRDKRSWKTLKLLPGKEKRWWYECINERGETITKEAYGRLPGIADERPLKESHPNVWVGLGVANATIVPLIGVLVGGVFGKKS